MDERDRRRKREKERVREKEIVKGTQRGRENRQTET